MNDNDMFYFYIRMLYPSYYFDMVDEVLKGNIKVEELVKVFLPKNVKPDLFKKTNDSNYYINSTNKQFILNSINLRQKYNNLLYNLYGD